MWTVIYAWTSEHTLHGPVSQWASSGHCGQVYAMWEVEVPAKPLADVFVVLQLHECIYILLLYLELLDMGPTAALEEP